jgi:cell division septation protein DedD
MATAQQDTEITLGTGRMLALFFALVLVCAGFFAIGFSLGRKAAVVGPGNVLAAQNQNPATVVRPTAGKNNPQPTPTSNDFSFYKAVEQKTADGQPPTKQTPVPPTATATPDANNPASDSATLAPLPTNAYYVQVAAVTRQEDADALVEALKKKQYPAFIASNVAGDKFYRVQVGPFTDIKDAELTRGRLTGDGYNPILKK